MKGVILAGGTGSRLHPLTRVTNKHLLPIYDKPMIYFPLQTLVNAGIEDIFVVTGGEHFEGIGRLLGSGAKLRESLGIEARVRFAYATQDNAGGIAEALGLARVFVGNDPVAVILGDNVFEDHYLLRDPIQGFQDGAMIFLREVTDDHQLFEIDSTGQRKAKFGIAELVGDRVVGIVEKPVDPKTRYAVTGLYVYDAGVFKIISTLRPSGRGELEITDVNNAYIAQGNMRFALVNGSWTDAGSHESLYRASNLVREQRLREQR